MSKRLRIGTFNLEHLGDERRTAPMEVRIRALRPLFERLDADVLCLQEINAVHPPGNKNAPRELVGLDRLLEGTPYASFERATTLGPSGAPADVHNLVVLSRYPIRDVRRVHHDLVPAPSLPTLTDGDAARAPAPVEWDRPFLAVELEVGAHVVHVLDVHLRSPLAVAIPGQKESPFVWKSSAAWAEGTFRAALKRAGQALEARLFVDAILDGDPDALVAVAGDFNASEHEVPTTILRAAVDATGSGALAGRELSCVDRLVPEHRRYSVVHAGAHVMIDHLMVTRALMHHVGAVEILNETLGDEVLALAVKGSPDSYHAPLVAEFTLP